MRNLIIFVYFFGLANSVQADLYKDATLYKGETSFYVSKEFDQKLQNSNFQKCYSQTKAKCIGIIKTEKYKFYGIIKDNKPHGLGKKILKDRTIFGNFNQNTLPHGYVEIFYDPKSAAFLFRSDFILKKYVVFLKMV